MAHRLPPFPLPLSKQAKPEVFPRIENPKTESTVLHKMVTTGMGPTVITQATFSGMTFGSIRSQGVGIVWLNDFCRKCTAHTSCPRCKMVLLDSFLPALLSLALKQDSQLSLRSLLGSTCYICLVHIIFPPKTQLDPHGGS